MIKHLKQKLLPYTKHYSGNILKSKVKISFYMVKYTKPLQ